MSTHRYADYWYLVESLAARIIRDPENDAVWEEALTETQKHGFPGDTAYIWSRICATVDHAFLSDEEADR